MPRPDKLAAYKCMKLSAVLCSALLAVSCVNQYSTTKQPAVAALLAEAQPEYLALFDSARRRAVPVVLYRPAGGRQPRLKVAIISHGYGGHSTDYFFIARNLVAHGYFVASIQHELPTDEPMPTTGKLYQVRFPYWERGVQNILIVRQELRRRYPEVDFGQLLLVGHSNGGDMSMLFAQEHPRLVQRVISLDNRRVAFPRARRPRILSLRSSDQVADSGVVHSPAEQRRFGSTVMALPYTRHNDMWDGATPAQQQEINAAISAFLEK